MAKAKKSIAKSAAVEKGLADAMERLAKTFAAGDQAVDIRTKDGKKFSVAVKRLSKRKATLGKKKKTAGNRVKKDPTRDNKAALRAVVKDLTTTTRDLTKAQAVKKVNATELAALKATHKRSSAYMKAVGSADKVLNKAPKKPKKKTA
jgi:hypothetical protein